MSERTSASDALDGAGAAFWVRRDLEDVMAGAEPRPLAGSATG
jgi:hypothetical protein